MADNLEDIKLTKQDLENATQYIKEIAILKGVKEGELKLSKETIRTMAKEIASGQYKADKELIKDVRSALKDAIREQKQAIQEQTRKNESFWSKIGFKESSKDDLATQYRARQMAGGVESIMEGRFTSGARQILSTFPKIANFMGGPYYLALQTVTSGLLKLDDAIAKARQEVVASTGGVFSPFRGDALGASLYRIQIGEKLRDYGLQDKAAEIMGAAYGSTGLGSVTYTQGPLKGQINKGLIEQRAINQGAALRYMGSLGISDSSINNLLKISRNLEGQSEIGALATQYRLAERFRSSRFMTEDEGAQQSLALYEQTKNLGINFEWASRTVRKFDEALQKGEITLNDIAALSRSIKGADQGNAVGLAAQLKDFAMRTGMNVPTEFMQSTDVGSGLLLGTSKMLGNKDMQRLLQAFIKERASSFGMGTDIATQAFQLQLALKSANTNISSDAAMKILQTGDWSLLTGGRGGVKPEIAAQQAQNLQTEAKTFYEEQRSVAKAISDGIGSLMADLKAGVLVKMDNGSWGDLINLLNPIMQTPAITKTFITGQNTLNDNGLKNP